MAVLSIRDFPDELLHRAKKLALDGRVSLKSVVIVALTKLTNGEEKIVTPEDNMRDTAGSTPSPKKVEEPEKVVRPKVPKPKATCKHGTEKGYRCWRCGDIAKVEKEPE